MQNNNQISTKTSNRYTKIKILTYDRLTYLILISKEKIVFFTSELLQQFQVFQNYKQTKKHTNKKN